LFFEEKIWYQKLAGNNFKNVLEKSFKSNNMSWKKDHQGKYWVIGRNCLLNFPEGFVLRNESIIFLETKSFELFQNWNAVFCNLK
jgi:hypothetical protein